MPLGFQRLNERTQRPNAHINFIKPLPTSSPEDQKIAQDFLERIAAQCYPVMKKDYISVMALEEYPPNPEFLGRNFNAGEVIQLVLKDKSGRWLSFNFVQMVMMHELAHCKQMNHSRYFWQVRNRYADHLKELRAMKYVGEGLWGRGQDLTNGQYVHDRMPHNPDIPEHLCGGTYRSARGKKRKRGQSGSKKPTLSYAERQQKRIARKFGAHGDGHDLGEDELVRGALEQGNRRSGKPRVAGSKRGRELRANAALARFDAAKKEHKTPDRTPELEVDDDSETESSADEYDDGLPILDTLEKIKDQRGRDMYRVCGREEEWKQDQDGLTEGEALGLVKTKNYHSEAEWLNAIAPKEPTVKQEDSETESEPEEYNDLSARPPREHLNAVREAPNEKLQQMRLNGFLSTSYNVATATQPSEKSGIACNGHKDALPEIPAHGVASSASQPMDPTPAPPDNKTACPVCSLENEPNSPTCMACSNVLKLALVPNYWRCKGEQCKRTKYVNAGDVGRCGLCGAQRPPVQSKPLGTTNASVLRWD